MIIGVLISGRGSNLRALAEAARGGRFAGTIALVVSNVADAPGLVWAREQGLETATIPHRDYPSRADHDAAVVAALRARGVELVCLAGYMRRLGPGFVQAYPQRILNVHPALLPAFPGLDAQAQALRWGVKVAGATVHIVDEELDHGPILLQEAVDVHEDDDEASLAARILAAEHRIYPRAVALLAEGRVRFEGRRARIVAPGAR